MNLYRTQVAQEILSTEENYVKTLREVVEVPHPGHEAGEIYIYIDLLIFNISSALREAAQGSRGSRQAHHLER
jgi:hypothetical protein